LEKGEYTTIKVEVNGFSRGILNIENLDKNFINLENEDGNWYLAFQRLE